MHVSDLDALGAVLRRPARAASSRARTERRPLPARLGGAGAPFARPAPSATAVGVERLSFRVRSNADLDPIEADFDAARLRRRAGSTATTSAWAAALRVWDPFGFPLEFFHEIERFETQLQRFDLQRGAPVMRLDHFNLHSPQVEETFAFWLELGFRCTEYISTDGDDERLTGAWLTRKPTVHDVALTAGRGPRLHHLGFYVAEPARGAARVRPARGRRLRSRRSSAGPGRHGVSNAFFVYLRDPDGHRIELYACDYYTGDPDLEPLRWSVSDIRCRSFWGARAPDSWYDESSASCSDPTERDADTFDANVDERTARSDVMA